MTKIAVIGIIGESVFLSVDDFGVTGQTTVASGLHRELGGKGFNQAVAAAKMGASVSFLGAAQHDDVIAYQKVAKKYGVTATLPAKNQPSPYAVIATDRVGDNRVCVYHGAKLEIADVYAFEKQIARADLLLLNNEVPTDVLSTAVALAKQHSTKVILNPAPARAYPPDFLCQIDLFTPNEHETLGLEDKENVVMTLGSRGCYLKQIGVQIPAEKVKRVVDTTGAGDTFNGVLAVLLAENVPLENAVQTANHASALKIQNQYVLDAIPTRKQIMGE